MWRFGMASIARSRAGATAARRCANATAARRCASATAARRRFASDATSSEAQRDGVTRAAVETKRPSRFEEAFEEFREGRAAQTLTLSAVQVVAERKIEEAMKSGAFDSLEGAGKPRVRTAFNDSAAEAVTTGGAGGKCGGARSDPAQDCHSGPVSASGRVSCWQCCLCFNRPQHTPLSNRQWLRTGLPLWTPRNSTTHVRERRAQPHRKMVPPCRAKCSHQVPLHERHQRRRPAHQSPATQSPTPTRLPQRLHP